MNFSARATLVGGFILSVMPMLGNVVNALPETIPNFDAGHPLLDGFFTSQFRLDFPHNFTT